MVDSFGSHGTLEVGGRRDLSEESGMSPSLNSFDARDTVTAGGRSFTIYRLDALEGAIP